MKKFIILFLLAGIATGHAQIIHLEEARVTTTPKIISLGDSRYVILEDYSGQFMKNPIGFMKENFNIHLYIEDMKGEDYDSYRVEFRNRKGSLVANFDDKGTLVSTSQRFKDIPLPLVIRKQLLANYGGWAMTKNLYIASGRGDEINKELYKVTMKNGKNLQRVKIVPDKQSRGLASNN